MQEWFLDSMVIPCVAALVLAMLIVYVMLQVPAMATRASEVCGLNFSPRYLPQMVIILKLSCALFLLPHFSFADDIGIGMPELV